MERLTTGQRAAMIRLSKSPMPHLPIRQMTARALAQRGLVDFVHPNGNVRLTAAGQRWLEALDCDGPMLTPRRKSVLSQDDAKRQVERSGAKFIPSGLDGLDFAASDSVTTLAKLLNRRIIKSITVGGSIKYVGEISY